MNKEKRCREEIEREKDGETGREVLKKHIEKEKRCGDQKMERQARGYKREGVTRKEIDRYGEKR